jgi:hypothetical protein
MTKQWETVVQQPNSEAEASKTERLAVPGGWLYRTFANGYFGMAFVPAPITTEVDLGIDLGGLHGHTK